MKGEDIKWFLLLIIISFIIGYFVFSPDYNGYSDLITFLSIIIGFKITSLSILFNSPLKKTLYDRKIEYYKTELHRLRDYFKFSITFKVISLIIIFILPNQVIFFKIKEINIQLGKHLIVLPILIGSFYCFYKIYNDLLKIFTHPTNH